MHALQWKKEIDTKVQLPNGKPLPVLLVGNKVSGGACSGKPLCRCCVGRRLTPMVVDWWCPPPRRPCAVWQCDIETASVDEEQLNRFCEENGFIGWFSTSAKCDINVEEAVRTLVRNILSHQDAFDAQAAAAAAAQDTTDLSLADGKDFDKPGCCS